MELADGHSRASFFQLTLSVSQAIVDTSDNPIPDERADRIEALFHQAADLPPAEQQALLDAACADDPGLRAEVEHLLGNDARLEVAKAEAFLQSPLIRSTARPPAGASLPAGSPSHLGRYRLIRLLGQGGMGAVYEAEQDRPRRTVALKVIRPGLASASLLERFLHESQILGRLHHPGIAQVYEAGLADDGQPLFAMEFIRGLALDEFARLRALTLLARVELVARVWSRRRQRTSRVIGKEIEERNFSHKTLTNSWLVSEGLKILSRRFSQLCPLGKEPQGRACSSFVSE